MAVLLSLPAVVFALSACGADEPVAQTTVEQTEAAPQVAVTNDAAEVAAYVAALRESKAYEGEFKPTWAEAVSFARDVATTTAHLQSLDITDPDVAAMYTAGTLRDSVARSAEAVTRYTDEILIPLQASAAPDALTDLVARTISALSMAAVEPTPSSVAALDDALAEWANY